MQWVNDDTAAYRTGPFMAGLSRSKPCCSRNLPNIYTSSAERGTQDSFFTNKVNSSPMVLALLRSLRILSAAAADLAEKSSGAP